MNTNQPSEAQAQENVALYTPTYGLFELRPEALDDPTSMVAFWTIGYEDRCRLVPRVSAERVGRWFTRFIERPRTGIPP